MPARAMVGPSASAASERSARWSSRMEHLLRSTLGSRSTRRRAGRGGRIWWRGGSPRTSRRAVAMRAVRSCSRAMQDRRTPAEAGSDDSSSGHSRSSFSDSRAVACLMSRLVRATLKLRSHAHRPVAARSKARVVPPPVRGTSPSQSSPHSGEPEQSRTRRQSSDAG